MHIVQLIKGLTRSLILPNPVHARHSEYSMLYSADDERSRPSPRLISLSLKAIGHAQNINVHEISKRMQAPPYFPDVWPGEHYRLLAGFMKALRPKVVVEIGTYTGISALAMKKYLPHPGVLHTFDVLPWSSLPDTCLREEDFKDEKLIQHIDDLSIPEVVERYQHLLKKADLLFIDAAKDGIMEQRFIDNFRRIRFSEDPIFLFDDIRLWNMLKIWREISLPKLDLTSFGHWSGTGIVEWKNE